MNKAEDVERKKNERKNIGFLCRRAQQQKVCVCVRTSSPVRRLNDREHSISRVCICVSYALGRPATVH